MGEHAVVYGAPALVAAVDLRARADLAAVAAGPSDRVTLELPDLGHREVTSAAQVVEYARAARERWEEYRRSPGRRSVRALRGGAPGHVAKVALGEAMRAASRSRGEGDAGAVSGTAGPRPDGDRGTMSVRLEVRSGIPVGRGFGSSAAVGAAVVSAWLAREGVELSAVRTEELLLDVERRQHGDPSGVDAAAVLRGGLVWAADAEEGEERRFESTSAPGALLDRFTLVDTGPPAESTGEVVAAVREWRDEGRGEVETAIAGIREATVRFRELLEGGSGPAPVAEAIRRCQRSLEQLGVVPEPVRRFVRSVEERGGAAKVSGAGALTSPAEGRPCGGLLLVFHAEPDRVRRWALPPGVEVLGARLGAEGTRLEAR